MLGEEVDLDVMMDIDDTVIYFMMGLDNIL